MVNCSYCGKELDRMVYCNPSHKVLYWRHKSPKVKVKPGKNDSEPKTVKMISKVASAILEKPHLIDHPAPGYHLSASLGKYVRDI